MMNKLSFVNFISFHLNLVIAAQFSTMFLAFHYPICEICLQNTTQKSLSAYEINILQHGKCFVRSLFTC